ncbi:Helix-turn-helix domain-containing protein [Lachnospiraceae bacterium NK3A20]|nr:Helix-turn-helix domain-containing protein [Lachnospiraceae bacterium NK3A20]
MMTTIKITLAAARVNAGLTQAQVAQKLHKTKQTIVNWENGKTTIDTANFTVLCAIYGIPESAIILPNKSS